MIVLSYGGGKQTVAVVSLVLRGELPKPDIIVMADTGRETSSTFQYLWDVVQPALKPAGLRVEIASHSLATVDLFTSSNTLLIPAFTCYSGKTGKLPAFCSGNWKRNVVRRFLRSRGVKDADLWIGISMDEVDRMKPSDVKWCRHVYPLIETKPMNRTACIQEIKNQGWPVPCKSRCWMCPNQSSAEWRELKNNAPDDFSKAVQLENRIQEQDKTVFLHKLCVPLVEAIERSQDQGDFFDGCDSGFCFV